MEAFYTRVLGMVVTDRGALPTGNLVFLSRDPSEHHQLVLCSGRPEPLGFTTINQISFRTDALADLRRLRVELVNAGASDIQPINHGVSWSVYARDPEGNRLEFFVDTPWYVPQPLREPLDLDRDDAAIEAESAARLTSDPAYKSMREWQAETAQRIAESLPA